MTVLQAAQFRLYPNKAQAAALDQWIGACRWCWNQFLDYEQYLYDKTGRFAFHKELSANLPAMKHVEGYEWLKDVPAIALVDVSRSMDLALRDFLARRGTLKPAGFPQFRKKKDLSGSVNLSGQVVRMEPARAEPGKAHGHVTLPDTKSRAGGALDRADAPPGRMVAARPREGRHGQARRRALVFERALRGGTAPSHAGAGARRAGVTRTLPFERSVRGSRCLPLAATPCGGCKRKAITPMPMPYDETTMTDAFAEAFELRTHPNVCET